VNARGFTLVEMLVALVAFAILSAAAVAMLNLTLRNKEIFDQTTASLQDIQMARAIMKADFAQVAARPVREAHGGSPRSSFAKGSDRRVLISFVRRGWDNPGGAEARISLQFVEYALEDGGLVRRARPYLDAAPSTTITARKLLGGVEAGKVAFLSGGKWAEQWRPVNEDSELPNAVAITLTMEGMGDIRQAFLTREN
jgi:general secretion pathway protein J